MFIMFFDYSIDSLKFIDENNQTLIDFFDNARIEEVKLTRVLKL